MKNQVKTPKMIRQRRFMLVLPLIALPFLTLMFWALGGGKMESADAQPAMPTGFNTKLPDANLKEDRVMDKMGYYDQAKLDSAKFLELVKNDPNYRMAMPDSGNYPFTQGPGFSNSPRTGGINTSLYGGSTFNDPNSEKIYQKLAVLNRELDKPVASDGTSGGYPGNGAAPRAVDVNSADVDRLEKMMQMMGHSETEDPEMQQINGMLEKIMDIQNPERVQQKLKQYSQSQRGQVFAVATKGRENIVSLLDQNGSSQPTGFYSMDEDDNSQTGQEQNAIQAVVHENQTIVNGSTVKFRLVNEVIINGVLIPRDSFIFGIASLEGERLGVKINSIRHNKSLYPVELLVYDMDGLDGIYIPGAITRDVAKGSADRSLQALGMASIDPSLGAQAAGAGIEAVKTLVSKKVKLVKVMVKAGYQVLLRDEKQKQDQSNKNFNEPKYQRK